MPLTDQNKTQLYSEAFMRNSKAVMGEQAFANADLKTHHDVAQMEIGVLRDELAAAQKEIDDLKEQLAQRPPALEPNITEVRPD